MQKKRNSNVREMLRGRGYSAVLFTWRDASRKERDDLTLIVGGGLDAEPSIHDLHKLQTDMGGRLDMVAKPYVGLLSITGSAPHADSTMRRRLTRWLADMGAKTLHIIARRGS